MDSKLCRWGFLSTAAIGRKNWKGVRLTGNATVTAVASRKAEAAETFIEECSREVPMLPERPAAVEGYDALLERDDVDAVYIPLPTSMRLEWVKKAAAAGKHVLCEKPIAGSWDEAQQMVTACREAGVQFMDGVMFSHSDRLTKLHKRLHEDRVIGNLRRIQAAFMFCGGPEFERHNIRTNSTLEPHGCLGDLGWYTIRLILWALNFELPERVVARTLKPLQGDASPAPVPGEFSAELFFSGGVSAGFYNSFVTEHQQLAGFGGDAGYITMEDFVLPFYSPELGWHENKNVLEIDNCRWNMRQHQRWLAVHEYGGGEANAQEVRMLRTFSDLVNKGRIDPFWPEIALKNQQVLEACRQSADAGGREVLVASIAS